MRLYWKLKLRLAYFLCDHFTNFGFGEEYDEDGETVNVTIHYNTYK